jgi:hypothetical protein
MTVATAAPTIPRRGRPHRAEQGVDRRQPGAEEHGHQQHAEHQRVGGQPADAVAVAPADRPRDGRRRADPQPHRQGADEHHHREDESHRRQRVGAELRDEVRVGQVERRHGEVPDQHRPGQDDQCAPDRAADQLRLVFRGQLCLAGFVHSLTDAPARRRGGSAAILPAGTPLA